MRAHHSPALALQEHRRFVIGLAGQLGRGRFDPEDLAQDVLERWLRCAARTGSVANPRGWMVVVLRRLYIDRVRRHQASRTVSADRLERHAIETETAPWWRELDAEAVERELVHLPPALRDTFRMFAFEARTYKQIARQLNIALGTVGVRISRARALLKTRLTASGQVCGGAGEATGGTMVAGGSGSRIAREVACRR